MRRMLVLNFRQFEKLPAESIAQILWSVHLDARMFFSTPPSARRHLAGIAVAVCQRMAEHR